MSKKGRTIIIALASIVLLWGAYYGITVHNRNRAAALFDEIPPTPTIGDLVSSDIVRIEVSGMVLEKQDDFWELVSLNGEAPPDWIVLDQSLIRGATFVLATVWAERIVDETPEDLSVYGLESPAARTVVTDIHGNSVVYLVGDITPAVTSYFVKREGNPNIFAVNEFSVRRLKFSLDDIRDRSLFPQLPLHALSRMRVESAQAQIDISPITEPVPLHLSSGFSRFGMTSPYSLPRGVDNNALQTLLSPLNNRRIEEFVNDFPSSLSPYGLDNPARLLLEFGDISIDLLIGNQSGADRYAKLAGVPGVFTVGGMEPFVHIRPFTLIDRFPLLFDIAWLTRLSISGGDRPLNAEIHGEGHDMVFYLNGRRAEEMSFRHWFQSVISLRIDAEMPPAFNLEPTASGNITIEHHLKDPPGERVSITLIPFSRDFYALSQDGTMEFLIARNQILRIFQAADLVVFES